MKVEKAYWDTDGVMEELIQPLVIDLDSASEDEDDCFMVDDDHSSHEDE